jgi:thioester reductase-like protein
VDWAFVPPVVIDEIGKHADLLDRLAARVKYLFFTGGAVPKHSGDAVAKRVAIWQVLGSSETASFPLIHATEGYSNAEDWQYVQFNPTVPLELRHQHEDLHELVVKRLPEKEIITPVWTTFPELKEYSTRDLLRPHPSKEGLWIYHSRNDDIIVFLNGEKTNPISFEEEIIRHPEVKAALVVGAQRFEAALLVELTKNDILKDGQKQALVDSIWPLVQKANAVTPAHARVSKSKILLVDPRKPMLRAGKGTVQRNATLKDHAKEIDELYEKDDALTDFVAPASGSQQDDVRSLLRNVVAELLHWDDLDLFQLGMDSLGALRLQKALKSRLPGLSLNTIYSNPSINALLKVTEVGKQTNGVAASDPTAELKELLEKYLKEVDVIERKPVVANGTLASGSATIFLTGSTGALGSHILHHLLSLPISTVARIYCFNRTRDAHARQVQSCQSRELTTDFPPDRVVFLAGDLSKPLFGLEQPAYAELLSNVTHIIHNAWPVNFNLSLSSFTPSIDGVVGLIKFAAQSHKRPALQFCSSISSVTRYPGATVPENIITDLSVAEFIGYGQSKYLSERLLHLASAVLGIRTSSARIGQVAGAGSETGRWNRTEWLPSLVVSSSFVGALPETLGAVPEGNTGFEETVNWVPMDRLAEVLVELSLEEKKEEKDGEVYHITHPKPVAWSSLVPSIRSSLPNGKELKLVPYQDWVALLKSKTAEAEADSSLDAATLAHRNPAMKLLGFFESLLEQGEIGGVRTELSLEKTVQGSKILRELEPIKGEWMEAWVRGWME